MRLLAICALAVLAPGALGAQQVVVPGTSVRLTTNRPNTSPIQGVLVESREGVVELYARGQSLTVPTASITRVQVEGPRDRRRGAVRGLLWGAVASIAVTAFSAPKQTDDAGAPPPRASVAEWIFYGVAAGSAAGAALGATIGGRNWVDVGTVVTR